MKIIKVMLKSSKMNTFESNENDEMIYVTNRHGEQEPFDLPKITDRINGIIGRQPKIYGIDVSQLVLGVANRMYPGINTSKIDEDIATFAANYHPHKSQYLKFAARLLIDNHHKNTLHTFIDKMTEVYYFKDKHGRNASQLSEDFYKYVKEHFQKLQDMIDYERDFEFSYFGFHTFLRMYSLKVDKKSIERPSDTFMRIAVAINMNSGLEISEELDNIRETYDAFSQLRYTHGSPTIFNSGTKFQQFASCFLLGPADSAESLLETNKHIGLISKRAGGLGIHMSRIRGPGAYIRGTGGQSDGLKAWIQMFLKTLRALNQGGKRNGSGAVYVMPHHPDIELFLKLRRPDGNEENRARELFYALWIPDLFMERVARGEMWSLIDPDTIDLSAYYDEFGEKKYTEMYLQAEQKGLYVKQLPARQIMDIMIETQRMTGLPYLCFSDTVNRCSMQKNIGVIRSSNLCSEIVEYSDENETAVCNLASLSLSKCVIDRWNEQDLAMNDDSRRELNNEFPLRPYFSFEHLIHVTKLAVRNLNLIIDRCFYPTEQCRRSNFRHRPIGVGVQGLADAYYKMRFPFDSGEARDLNRKIFETIYFAALSESCRLSRKIYQKICQSIQSNGRYIWCGLDQNGEEVCRVFTDVNDVPTNIGSYSSMTLNKGSPIASGVFHWELAGLSQSDLSGMYDWSTLKKFVQKYGVRNSLLVALMPTSSTSQFLGNIEAFEPPTTNLYQRRTLAGEFYAVNKYLLNDLRNLKLDTNEMKEKIQFFSGSIQSIPEIPAFIRRMYRTAYEIDPKELINQAADRQPFVDQAQSLNWFLNEVVNSKIIELMFLGWKRGLKTVKYYLHSKPAVQAQQFTIDPRDAKKYESDAKKIGNTSENERAPILGDMQTMDNFCDSCGS